MIIVMSIGLVLIIVASLVLNYLYVRQVKDSYQLEIDLAKNEIEENTEQLYTATQEIKKGGLITKENTILANTFTSLDKELFITEEDLNKVVIIDIPLNMPIQKNMISDYIKDDLREEEFNVFYLNTNLKANDYVDIRILFPNGENYIVLSKKELKSISLENKDCFLWLDANEIHNISSAIVDAYLHDGAKLYTTKYIEPNIQEPSIVTYTPNSEVIDLIKLDPNVINKAKESLSKEIREGLEDRLEVFYKDYQGEVQWQESIVPIDSGTNNTSEEPEEEFYYVE